MCEITLRLDKAMRAGPPLRLIWSVAKNHSRRVALAYLSKWSAEPFLFEYTDVQPHPPIADPFVSEEPFRACCELH